MASLIKDLYHFLSPKFQNVFLDYKVDMKPRWTVKPHPLLNRIVEENRKEYEQLLAKAVECREELQAIQPNGQEKDAVQPVWNNGFLPGLDIMMIYTLITHFKPENYLEVGSGNSTKVAYKAIKDHQLQTRITSIDPMPRAEIDQLANRIVRKPFESVDHTDILALKENDILFIDNSHRILPNSDAMVFFLEILPNLQKGVIVHIHDIYIPFDYPQFMCDRAYSEQYGLAMYLLANPKKYQVIMPNYFVFKDKALSGIIEPVFDHPNLKDVERHGGSFWIRIAE